MRDALKTMIHIMEEEGIEGVLNDYAALNTLVDFLVDFTPATVSQAAWKILKPNLDDGSESPLSAIGNGAKATTLFQLLNNIGKTIRGEARTKENKGGEYTTATTSGKSKVGGCDSGVDDKGMKLYFTFLKCMNELKRHERYNKVDVMIRDAYVNEYVVPDEDEDDDDEDNVESDDGPAQISTLTGLGLAPVEI